MSNITRHTDYRLALAAVTRRTQTSQTSAVLAVRAQWLTAQETESELTAPVHDDENQPRE